jgi:hypothetical protein
LTNSLSPLTLDRSRCGSTFEAEGGNGNAQSANNRNNAELLTAISMQPAIQRDPHDKQWNEHAAWHTLFDAVCTDRGHHDTKSVANLFCAATGRQSRLDFETACKNIGNWRLGRRTPRRHHFGVLTQVLNLDADPDLRLRWNALYRGAQSSSGAGMQDAHAPARPEEAGSVPAATSRSRLAWAAALGIGVASAIFAVTLMRQPLPPSGELSRIAYVPSAQLRVGETVVLHAARPTECGAAPHPWGIVKTQLPTLPIGEWSDGGIVLRGSAVCGKSVPARALQFTATTPGTAAIVLEGDAIAIQVRE